MRLGAIKLSATDARFFRALRGTNQGVGAANHEMVKQDNPGQSPISVNVVGLYEKFGFCPEGAVGLSLGF
jgi:hypothetical protein